MKDSEARVGARPGDDPFILTASGRALYFMRPTADSISPDDIATQTSQLCRFTGATNQFYSVAQHNVLVAQLIKHDLDASGADKWSPDYYNQILAGLLHDAAEAYVNDLSSPLKYAMRGKYKWIETGILRCIFQKFKVDWDYMNAAVKAADNIALIIERFWLMPDHPDWPKGPAGEMQHKRPVQMDPTAASNAWLNALRLCIMNRNKYQKEFGDLA